MGQSNPTLHILCLLSAARVLMNFCAMWTWTLSAVMLVPVWCPCTSRSRSWFCSCWFWLFVGAIWNVTLGGLGGGALLLLVVSGGDCCSLVVGVLICWGWLVVSDGDCCSLVVGVLVC